MVTFGPNNWGYTEKYPSTAYTADSPRLCDLEAYSPDSPKLWIKAQVLALFLTSQDSKPTTQGDINLFSEVFSSEVKDYKLTELMLFFARYKAGMYDNSYLTYDSRKIGHAFFKEFLPERRAELERILRRAEQAEIAARRFVPPKGYSSLTWYRECLRRASMGDEEAIQLLRAQWEK